MRLVGAGRRAPSVRPGEVKSIGRGRIACSAKEPRPMAQSTTDRPRPPDEEPNSAPDNPNAWLVPLIGAGFSDDRSDVSSNIHKYVAEAILREAPKPDPT